MILKISSKLSWPSRRLFNNPDSLIAKIYKGKYYANKSFMDCGILFGRELLSKGLIKSIGDGKTTLVWSEKWIMDEAPRRPVNRNVEIDVNLKVENLLHGNG